MPLKARGAVLLQAAFLALGVAFVYAPAIRGGWVWDDAPEVSENPVLRDPQALTRIWLHPPGTDYFPVKSTVQLAAWRLWGGSPLGYHLLGAGLHLLCALLFWRLLRRLGAGEFGSWAGSLLFAVHPLAVESVAWISELKNTLSLALMLGAGLFWLWYDEGAFSEGRDGRPARPDQTFAIGGADGRAGRPSLPWQSLALGLFTLAMLAKSTVAMFPAALLLHAWWRRGRVGRADLLASAPFFLVALGLGGVTVWFQQTRAVGGLALHAGGIVPRLAGAGLAAAFYLSKAVAPAGLLPVYPRWNVDPPSILQFLPWLAFAALFLLLRSRRSAAARATLFGLGFFLLNLLPILGLVPLAYLRISWVADHFAYISLLGIAGLAGAGLGAWRERGGATAAALAILALALGLGARAHARIFTDNRTLWAYELGREPRSWMAHNNLGEVLYLEGRKEEAGGHFRQAVELEPDDPGAHFNLGLVLSDAGRLGEAMDQFREALRLKPAFPEAQNSLGIALLRSGRKEEAIAAYRAAAALGPGYPEAHCNLGLALEGAGRAAEAAAELERALALRPDYAQAHLGLGDALLDLGRLPEAIGHYQRALVLKPANAGAEYGLGNALAESGRPADAAVHYEAALRLDPSLADAHNNLGVALTDLGRLAEAREQFRAALRLKPDYATARANLEKLGGTP